jgi:hypothetical protein
MLLKFIMITFLQEEEMEISSFLILNSTLLTRLESIILALPVLESMHLLMMVKG